MGRAAAGVEVVRGGAFAPGLLARALSLEFPLGSGSDGHVSERTLFRGGPEVRLRARRGPDPFTLEGGYFWGSI